MMDRADLLDDVADNLLGAALVRWQIPELDPRREPAMAPPAPAAPDGEPPAATAPAAAFAAEPDSAPPDPRPTAAIEDAIAAARAAGYAEGLARGRAEGDEQGYAAGHAAGVAAAQAAAADAAAAQQALAQEARRLAEIALHLAAPIPALEWAVEEALVGLALELARWVIGAEVSRSHEHLVGLIREALAQAPFQVDGVEIILNPADIELVRTRAPEIETAGAAVLVADAAIEAGGAHVVVSSGERRTNDRRWHPRSADGAPQVDLSLAERWRNAMLTLFDGEYQ
jgi:flagellar assembly protein FliH